MFKMGEIFEFDSEKEKGKSKKDNQIDRMKELNETYKKEVSS